MTSRDHDTASDGHPDTTTEPSDDDPETTEPSDDDPETTEPSEPIEVADFPADTAVKARLRLIGSAAAIIIGIVYFWAAATRAPIQVGAGDTTYGLSATALVIFGIIMILGAVMLVIEWAQMRPDEPPGTE